MSSFVSIFENNSQIFFSRQLVSFESNFSVRCVYKIQGVLKVEVEIKKSRNEQRQSNLNYFF